MNGLIDPLLFLWYFLFYEKHFCCDKWIEGVFMKSHTIYLCGPITGLSLDQSTNWRRDAILALSPHVNVIDPTRDFPDPIRRSVGSAHRALSTKRLVHGKRTLVRDRFDIQRSDIVLACFLNAKHVSIGSVGEIFWADILRKPVIIIREEDNPHNHDMLNEIAGWIFDDFAPAIEQVKKLIVLNC